MVGAAGFPLRGCIGRQVRHAGPGRRRHLHVPCRALQEWIAGHLCLKQSRRTKFPEHAGELHPCAVQVNWGLLSGKYLSAALGSARSYVQVCAAVPGVEG